MRVGGAGYALKKLVGRGGLGEVWVAWDRKQEKDVALKFLPQGLMRDPHLLELVQSQVEQARKLDHAVIVRIYDFVRDYENVAIAMEYVQGWSLAALKVDRPQKRYRVEELSKWVPALCLALEYAHHETNLVHRDLKPGNLLIDAREHVRITDFAISHAVRSALAQQGHLVYGAVAYMSPQQVKGALPSILDDVYSLGATVFDLLTGTPPFYAGEIMTQVF
jgi:serine/threonine protein kinase